MPLTETVTIINKSGKVVSTGKHLVNIFKEAKYAYNEKKADLKAEYRAQLKHRDTQRLIDARDDVRSTTSSRHSHRSHKSHRSGRTERALEDCDPISKPRPPLTQRNLSYMSEGSVASSRRSRSHHGSRRPRSPVNYKNPYMETSTELAPIPGVQRRHTDMEYGPTDSALSRGTMPPPYKSQLTTRPPLPLRSQSNPDFHDKDIDMNLAYGKLPPDLLQDSTIDREQELQNTMSRLDNLLIEAQCLQHSATAIITTLQANPEAMAAVALTLAELSNLLTKMSPSILTMLKASSPAVFGLLASPQFLIAGGVALGVTVVMFGGYKIVKRLQAETTFKEPKMEEALVYDNVEMGSVESWRRGISNVDVEDVQSLTSVDGEFITPEAARQKKERIRERKREERDGGRTRRAGSESGETIRSSRTVRRVGSDNTLRQRDIPIRASSSRVGGSVSGRSERKSKVAASETGKSEKKSRVAESESGKSRRSRKEKQDHDEVATVVSAVIDGERKKKSLSTIFKRNGKKGKDDIRESVLSAGPLIEV